ncbi:septal ring lytic transglycosylase RlpA family protein [Aestuariibacter salexigens]|uniref:septal ring lytic transglycosylase RlpA family protein n=1 Tax=Aestuariibacter salexigens TaxID=226010 RepID=UPI000425F22D|nr:septal ring lytic transglycosylase RlpA family protein [Aestuariibacter salexigens]
MRHLVLCLLLAALAGCQNSGRYSQHTDSAPDWHYGEINAKDAEPAYEPYAPQNLKPYEVFGKRYTPLKTGKGYTAEGIASWYGQKFHGHLTSNGEIYDMFSMTAAHKTLPLPSFARVTNLDNGKQVVVRINDRGPFHANREIDLSYAAAKKLGFLPTGTARIKLDVIHIDEQGTMTVGNQPVIEPIEQPEPAPLIAQQSDALFIQVAALSDRTRLEQLAQGLASLYDVDYQLPHEDNIHKLRLGPIKNNVHAEALLQDLRGSGFPSAYTVYSAP